MTGDAPTPLSDEEYRRLMERAPLGDPAERAYLDGLTTRLYARRNPEEDRPRTARHEAGHAVVAHRLGYAVKHVAIRDDGTGGTNFKPDWQPRRPPEQKVERLRARAAVFCAGVVAEELGWGRARCPERANVEPLLTGWRVLILPYRTPTPEVLTALRDAGVPDGRDEAMPWLLRTGADRARAILVAHATAVDGVAAALLMHDELPQERLLLLLGGIQTDGRG